MGPKKLRNFNEVKSEHDRRSYVPPRYGGRTVQKSADQNKKNDFDNLKSLNAEISTYKIQFSSKCLITFLKKENLEKGI